MNWKHNDGGEAKWLRKKENRKIKIKGGCVARALAISEGISYADARNLIEKFAIAERSRNGSRGSDPSQGVKPGTLRRIAKHLKWKWKAQKFFGEPTEVHVKQEELPKKGTYVLRLSKHITVLKDGIIHDTYDPSRKGVRTVYGFWKVPKK